MKYLVYLTICTENNKIYVGVHETENPDIFDCYIGCGVRTNVPASYKKSKTPFQYAVNKYGVKAFKRITLQIFNKREDAFELEKSIVNKDFIQRKDTYNIKLGGEGGCPEIKKKKVYLYDKTGKFYMEFESALECAKHFKPTAKNGSHVFRACRCGHLFYGFQVSFEKVANMKQFVKTYYNQSPNIIKCDVNGSIIEEFSCINAAIRAGYTNVRKNLLGKTKTCKGYIFKYKDMI